MIVAECPLIPGCISQSVIESAAFVSTSTFPAGSGYAASLDPSLGLRCVLGFDAGVDTEQGGPVREFREPSMVSA